MSEEKNKKVGIVKTAYGYAKVDGARICDICRCASRDGDGTAFAVGVVGMGKRARLSPLAEIVKNAVVDTWDEFNEFTTATKSEKTAAKLCKKFAEREGLILGRNAEEIIERAAAGDAENGAGEKRAPKTADDRRADLVIALAKHMVTFKIDNPDKYLKQLFADVKGEYDAQKREAETKAIRKMEKMAGKAKKAK